jgi:TniQ
MTGVSRGDEARIHAPRQVPLAPRPFDDEILSSWLLRVAAANSCTLDELLDGLEAQHPGALHGVGLLDFAVPRGALESLGRFCRIAVMTLERLDLQRHAPQLEPVILLRFPQSSSARRPWQRVRYAHCPICLRTSPPYVRWDWCFAALTRCASHRVALHDGCQRCGDVDPLGFSAPDPQDARCKSCRAPLSEGRHRHPRTVRIDEEGEDVVGDAYRAALRAVAPHPALLGKATHGEFRCFVNDMLQILSQCLEQHPACPTRDMVPREDLLTMISALIRNAAPSASPRQRSARYRRSLVLWVALIRLIDHIQGDRLEEMSRRWPVALRRRFESGMLRRSRKRWPGGPFSHNRPGVSAQRRRFVAVCDLGHRATAPPTTS